jgi:hypothetical protein
MRTPRVTVGTRNANRLVFKRCDWPPRTASSEDGYSEVVNTSTDLHRGAAEEYSDLDSLQGGCDRIAVTYVLDHMFAREFVSGVLRVGRLYVVTTTAQNGEPVVIVRRLNEAPPDVQLKLAPPSRNRIDVLRSGHVALFDARCVPDE